MDHYRNTCDVQVRLSFVGSLLARVDVAICTNLKESATLSLEHPILYLARLFQQCGSRPQIDDEKPLIQLINDTEEVKKNDQIEAHVVKLWNSSYMRNYNDLITSIKEGLKIHLPELCDEGVNGTYFMKNIEGKFIGVFKPEDEEAQSSNNPKASPEKEEKLAILGCLQAGDASKREVAAYLLDKEGFFGVPRTAMVEIDHASFQNKLKIGSLQEFIENDGASWDIGPSVFPTREVHKIGILDLYMFNFDRHGGNILFKKENGTYSLIPIDNGFSLPDTVCIPNLWFEWLNWPQAKKQFDEETRAFIEKLNPDEDAAMLKKELGIRDECLKIMKMTATLLKKGAAAGMTLYDIACLVCRVSDPDEPSQLETLYASCAEKAQHVGGEEAFLNYFATELDNTIRCCCCC